ncbi:hypothetical protein CBR_g22461 [Chara braunii]|uniref:Reverse transcriptase n=1 Tax=Chara braunii TaxID=69332 RepID=A0A388L2Q5_CHABU|nr:hypothetical protein CBR_g22461 [Chara braunii]|eukprot:GBG76581.1 hypothetical protein CBR_g22461 [Chara braunii]
MTLWREIVVLANWVPQDQIQGIWSEGVYRYRILRRINNFEEVLCVGLSGRSSGGNWRDQGIISHSHIFIITCKILCKLKKEAEEQLKLQQARVAELARQEAAELEAATDHSRREYLLQQLEKSLTDDRCAQITKHMAEMILLEHKITSSQFTNWDDRFVRLERRVDELSAQQSKILESIQGLSAQLAAAKLITPQLPLLKPKTSPPPSPPPSPPSSHGGSVHSSRSSTPSRKASVKATYAAVTAADRGPKIPAPNKFRGDDPKTDVGDWAAETRAYLRGFVCAEQTKVATVLGLLEGPALKWATSTSSSLQQSMEDWAFGLGVDKLLQALEDRFADKERARKAADRIARLGQLRYSGTLQALFAEFEQLTSTPGLVMAPDDMLTSFCRAAPEKFVVALYSVGYKDWRSFGRAALEMEAKLHVQAPTSDKRKGAFPRGSRRGKAALTHVGSASGSDTDSQPDVPSGGIGSAAETDVAAVVTQAVLGALQSQRKFSTPTASATTKGKDKGRESAAVSVEVVCDDVCLGTARAASFCYEDPDPDQDPGQDELQSIVAFFFHLKEQKKKGLSELIMLRPLINRTRITGLLDCGATRNFISPSAVKKLHLGMKVQQLQHPLQVQIGDSTVISIREKVKGIPVTFDTAGKVRRSLNFYVFPDLPFDLVFSMQWLRAVNPRIDWQIPRVVDQYADLMQEPFGLPNRPTKHHIELLPGAVPPKGRIYKMSPAKLEELRKQLETLTSKGWIRPNTSEFGAPVLFVPKGNGEFRMCIDYRGLNKITRKSTEPLPRIDDLLDMVQGCTVFSKVDLKSGYHQIEMAEEDVYKTAFKTRYGTYEFLVMPFGLCNAPGTFQTEMHRIFRPYLDKFMVVYLDDILAFSKTAREHAKHLALVLQSLRDSQYKINREKSSFGVPSVIYLGHVISGDGLAPEAAKIAVIQEWPQPQTVRDVRSFMGLASYYRKFVRNFSAVAAHLTNLTKKDTPFLWFLHCQLAFTRLKKALTRAPVLKLPDPTLPFILTTDASQYGIGAVLQQDDGNGLRPVKFMSKKIKTQKLQDSTYEKELYAFVCALKHWKHFLLGRHFKIFSDHSTLQWMKSHGELNDKLARYTQFIDMFEFELKHKKGCYNKVADALSRRPDSFALISSTHSFGEETRQTIARLLPQDETFGPIVRNLQADPNSEPGYAMSSDLLYTYNRDEERLCIPQDQRLRTLLLSKCHDARGHFGFLKSYAALLQRFFWKEMRSEMLRYVDTCELCQRTKVQRKPPLGLLKPLPIPDGPAQSVSIDFTDLGKTTPRGMRQVMVCMDRFSKYAEFIPLPKVARVPAVRAAFSERWVTHHGPPISIVSDRDPRFCSDEWQSYCKDYLHSQMDMTYGHHPEANGLAEVMNQVLFQLLRPVISPDQQDWDLHLARAQLMYNMSVHSSTGFSPYRLHWGREPRQPLDDIIDKAKPDLTPGTAEFARRYRLDMERARANLFKAQKAMIEQVNRHRRPPSVLVIMSGWPVLSCRGRRICLPSCCHVTWVHGRS